MTHHLRCYKIFDCKESKTTINLHKSKCLISFDLLDFCSNVKKKRPSDVIFSNELSFKCQQFLDSRRAEDLNCSNLQIGLWFLYITYALRNIARALCVAKIKGNGFVLSLNRSSRNKMTYLGRCPNVILALAMQTFTC